MWANEAFDVILDGVSGAQLSRWVSDSTGDARCLAYAHLARVCIYQPHWHVACAHGEAPSRWIAVRGKGVPHGVEQSRRRLRSQDVNQLVLLTISARESKEVQCV